MGQLDTQTLDSCALGSNRYKLLWDSISMGLFQGLLSQLLFSWCFVSNCTLCSFPLRPLFRCAQDRHYMPVSTKQKR